MANNIFLDARQRSPARAALGICAAVAASLTSSFGHAESSGIADRLQRGYPGIITAVSGNTVHFADGSTLPLDDGRGEKPFADWLAIPDIEDMFKLPYPPGDAAAPPPPQFDPGRARNEAFFTKVYGDCRKGEVETSLVDVIWLPKKSGQRLKATRINGVAAALQAVSDQLDALPAAFDTDLFPAAGTYNCRAIAGTASLSAHGLGIAIDIALKRAHYWRWEKKGIDGAIGYRNALPMEIVRIFERHGFIWGGKWSHFDTMHFEYRPELLTPFRTTAPAATPPEAPAGPATGAAPGTPKDAPAGGSTGEPSPPGPTATP
ncbi:MAG: M15 family metallopeptidase [Hyphomicrobium sp.]